MGGYVLLIMLNDVWMWLVEWIYLDDEQNIIIFVYVIFDGMCYYWKECLLMSFEFDVCDIYVVVDVFEDELGCVVDEEMRELYVVVVIEMVEFYELIDMV